MTRVLGDVRLAVADWKAMRDKVLSVVAEIEQRPPPIPPWKSKRDAPSCAGSPTTTSRFWAIAATNW